MDHKMIHSGLLAAPFLTLHVSDRKAELGDVRRELSFP